MGVGQEEDEGRKRGERRGEREEEEGARTRGHVDTWTRGHVPAGASRARGAGGSGPALSWGEQRGKACENERVAQGCTARQRVGLPDGVAGDGDAADTPGSRPSRRRGSQSTADPPRPTRTRLRHDADPVRQRVWKGKEGWWRAGTARSDQGRETDAATANSSRREHDTHPCPPRAPRGSGGSCACRSAPRGQCTAGDRRVGGRARAERTRDGG